MDWFKKNYIFSSQEPPCSEFHNKNARTPRSLSPDRHTHYTKYISPHLFVRESPITAIPKMRMCSKYVLYAQQGLSLLLHTFLSLMKDYIKRMKLSSKKNRILRSKILFFTIISN